MNLYALFGLALFFALGFGTGVGYATRRLAPRPAPAVRFPNGNRAFRDDLNRRLEDPEFKRGYDEATARIRECYARMADQDPS